MFQDHRCAEKYIKEWRKSIKTHAEIEMKSKILMMGIFREHNLEIIQIRSKDLHRGTAGKLVN